MVLPHPSLVARLGLLWLDHSIANRPFDSDAGGFASTAAAAGGGTGDGGTEASGAGAGGTGNSTGDGAGDGAGSCAGGWSGTGGTGGTWRSLIVVQRVDGGLGLVDEGVSRDICIAFEGFLGEETTHIQVNFTS